MPRYFLLHICLGSIRNYIVAHNIDCEKCRIKNNFDFLIPLVLHHVGEKQQEKNQVLYVVNIG